MHWQEAVAQSATGQAIRTTRRGQTIIRDGSGKGRISFLRGAGWQEATGDQMDGFDDWLPKE